MKLDLDSNIITLTCESCDKKIKETFGRIKNKKTMTCPGCRKTFVIDADKFRRGLESVQKSADGIGRALRNLGK